MVLGPSSSYFGGARVVAIQVGVPLPGCCDAVGLSQRLAAAGSGAVVRGGGGGGGAEGTVLGGCVSAFLSPWCYGGLTGGVLLDPAVMVCRCPFHGAR